MWRHATSFVFQQPVTHRGVTRAARVAPGDVPPPRDARTAAFLYSMMSSTPFLFATGVENSYPTIAGGVRIDQMDKCGHYARWEEDFALVRESGLNALRYGPPYYRVHTAPNTYDWDVCDAQMQRLRELELTVIADLCHFGVPSWLGGFQDPAFPVLFAEYARAFAHRYPWIRHFTPVNEIFIAANFSALKGWWNECEKSDRAFVRAIRNLCMAHELAVEAILSERPDAIIVQGDRALPRRGPRRTPARGAHERREAPVRGPHDGARAGARHGALSQRARGHVERPELLP